MIKETYERLQMDVTRFDFEDVITTSGDPDLYAQNHEMIWVPTGGGTITNDTVVPPNT